MKQDRDDSSRIITSGQRGNLLCLVLAGASYWCHVNLVWNLSSTTSASDSIIAGAPAATGLFPSAWAMTLLGNLLGLGLFALLARKNAPLVERKLWPIISCTLASGSALLLLANLLYPSHMLVVVAGFIGGCGQSMAFVLFAELFSSFPLGRILLYAGLQQLVALIPCFALSLFDRRITLLFALGFALTQCLLLIKLGKNGLPQQDSDRSAIWLSARDALPMLSIAAITMGMCYGASIGLLAHQNTAEILQKDAFSLMGNILGMAIGGCLLVASSELWRGKNPEDYLYQIAVPLLALGIAALPSLSSTLYAAVPILLACSIYFFGLLWFLIALSSGHPSKAGFHAALGFLGFFFGHLASRLLIDRGPVFFANPSTISTVLFLALVLLLVLYIAKYRRYERHRIEQAREAALNHGCSYIGKKYQLTEREEHILLLLARGRSTKDMAEELVLSENTVKTHTRHLYTKLDIHSKEELTAIVNEGVKSALDYTKI